MEDSIRPVQIEGFRRMTPALELEARRSLLYAGT
jgi:hypothetical protein